MLLSVEGMKITARTADKIIRILNNWIRSNPRQDERIQFFMQKER